MNQFHFNTIAKGKRMAYKVSPEQIAFMEQETQQDGRKETQD